MGPGYSAYGEKIDWLMALLAPHPVWWTNLPAEIVPPEWLTGCLAVNSALAAAEERWPNLTVLDWAAVADPHPEYVTDHKRIHITWKAATAWAQAPLTGSGGQLRMFNTDMAVLEAQEVRKDVPCSVSRLFGKK